jgi:4-alpha-glucanotransferase
MNVPGCGEGNWRWRCTQEMLSGPAFEWLRTLTTTSNRSAELPSPQAVGRVEATS